ncbi:MAG TPA: 3-dehydroquinate synthase, partial [Geminicoccaceae bacterium]|nr:3-dehydroquinate synthase [Geminicoccaceae bacterium]
DRHSYVIAIGGGALLDAVGLAAATIHRGVRLIRVPTTVLSQDDSGVGVKNGVNLFGVKNFCGTFAPPFAVLNDLDLLTPLAQRDKIAGMAEAVKVALIRDGAFFAWLERHADELITFQRRTLAQMIRRCAELHMRQIAQGGDPFETGSARPLDYGHWSAHKLESLTKHHVRHGEAVAIGIALDARYSVLAGLLAEGQDGRIFALLEHLGFRLWHPALEARRPDGTLALFKGLREFREHLGGELTVTLLEDIGRGIEVHEIDETRMLEAMNWLKERAETP